jgi:hypothetical protein
MASQSVSLGGCDVSSGARSAFTLLAVGALAACSIDLSELQRSDAGFNPASDPDSGSTGSGGMDANTAGVAAAGSSGQAGTGTAGQIGKAGAGGAGSSAAGRGSAGAGGMSGTDVGTGAGAGAMSIAGMTGTAGGSMPTAGSTSQPPAAGQSAAGAPSIDPTRTCGVPGLPCCNPGNMCDIGACLRGKCTPYGGFYANTGACSTNPCGSRNAYTAGCHCPVGFTDTLLWSEDGPCDEGGSGVTEVRSCTAGRTPGIAFAGAWVQGPDDSCSVGCQTKNPLTGMCTCPAGTQQLSMTVDLTNASCPDAGTTLQVCIEGEGMPVNFGGAYAVSQSAPLGCGAANPLTAACSCPAEVMTPQSLHTGSWSIFVCNL